MKRWQKTKKAGRRIHITKFNWQQKCLEYWGSFCVLQIKVVTNICELIKPQKYTAEGKGEGREREGGGERENVIIITNTAPVYPLSILNSTLILVLEAETTKPGIW